VRKEAVWSKKSEKGGSGAKKVRKEAAEGGATNDKGGSGTKK
jgi:hypothetical protein